MVNFYRYVFDFFPEHMVIAIKACVNQQFISPIKKVKSSYDGLPTRKDVVNFRKKGGRVIDWKDFFRFRG